MSIFDFIALCVAVFIFVAAAGVAWYKWYNTRADFSPRNDTKVEKK